MTSSALGGTLVTSHFPGSHTHVVRTVLHTLQNGSGQLRASESWHEVFPASFAAMHIFDIFESIQ